MFPKMLATQSEVASTCARLFPYLTCSAVKILSVYCSNVVFISHVNISSKFDIALTLKWSSQQKHTPTLIGGWRLMAFHHIFLTFLSFGTLTNNLSGVEYEVLVHPGVIHHLFCFVGTILHPKPPAPADKQYWRNATAFTGLAGYESWRHDQSTLVIQSRDNYLH